MSYIPYNAYLLEYQFVQKIGQGNTGSVYVVRNIQQDKIYVVKEFIKKQFHQSQEFINQMLLIKQINDKALPEIYHYYMKGGQNNVMGLIMEYIQYDLQYFIDQKIRIDDQQMSKFMYQMIRVFCKMERLSIIHRDIKPGNIMLNINSNNQPIYKIIDFGYAAKINKYSNKTFTGTRQYASPKVKRTLQNPSMYSQPINSKDDVFSLGKVFLSRYTLHEYDNQQISKLDIQKLNEKYNPIIMGIIKSMLEFDENQRWTFVQLSEYLDQLILGNEEENQIQNNYLEDKNYQVQNEIQNNQVKTAKKLNEYQQMKGHRVLQDNSRGNFEISTYNRQQFKGGQINNKQVNIWGFNNQYKGQNNRKKNVQYDRTTKKEIKQTRNLSRQQQNISKTRKLWNQTPSQVNYKPNISNYKK